MTTEDSVEEIREEHRRAEAYDKEHRGKSMKDTLRRVESNPPKKDELLLTEAINLLWKYRFPTQEEWEMNPLEAETKAVQACMKVEAEEILTKVKQHLEQKRLDRPELREKILILLHNTPIKREMVRGENTVRVDLERTSELILALIPDIEELKRYRIEDIAEVVAEIWRSGKNDSQVFDFHECILRERWVARLVALIPDDAEWWDTLQNVIAAKEIEKEEAKGTYQRNQ